MEKTDAVSDLLFCRRQASLFGVRSPSARPLEISPQGGTVENNIHRKGGRFAPFAKRRLFCESAPLERQIPQRQIASAAVFALKPLLGAFAALGFRSPAHGRPFPAVRAVCQRLPRSGRAARLFDELRRLDDRRLLSAGRSGCVFADYVKQVPIQGYRLIRHDTPPPGRQRRHFSTFMTTHMNALYQTSHFRA